MTWWGNQSPEVYARGWDVFGRIKRNINVALDVDGLPAYLWLPLLDGVKCSCVRENVGEKLCNSCYGTGFIGGYHRYGFDYIEVYSIDTGLTYNSSEVELNNSFRPFRLQLKPDVNSAEVLSGVYDWVSSGVVEYRLDALKRGDNNSVSVSYSLNSGDWKDISLLGSEVGSGSIRFKIVLQRETGARSPLFEILRVRRQAIDEPYILIARSRNPSDNELDKFGLREKESGIRFWTIFNFEISPLSFVEIAGDQTVGRRYRLYNLNKSWYKEIGFRWAFDVRLISDDMEVYGRVF